MSSSNAVSTVDQYRQSYQFSATVDGLLKNVYLDALNNTTFHATPLMEMFGDYGGRIDFEGNQIIKAFKEQGAGGFGGISEGGDFVKGRNQKGFQGNTRIKYLNAFFSLTGPSSRTVKTGKGAYVDSVSSAMDDTLRLAKMQMERIAGGAGDGELTRTPAFATGGVIATTKYVNAVGVTSDTPVALTASAAAGYTKVQWLQPGLRVSLITDGNFDGSLAATTEMLGAFEIGHVDYAADTFSLKNISGGNITIAADTYVMVLENAYGSTETDGGSSGTADTPAFNCLELNGLYNIVSDGVDHSGVTGNVNESGDKYAKIWNTTRSTHPHALKSTVKANVTGTELDEELLIDWVLDLVNIKQSIPNVLVTDPKARLKYFSNRKEDRRFDMKVMDSMFGFRSIGVVIDQYNLLLQSLSSLTPGTLFMLNTNAFKYAKATDGFNWIEEGGRILRNRETSDNLFGTAVNYCEFVCEDPKGQLKATNLAT
jgi:hypothetical protein